MPGGKSGTASSWVPRWRLLIFLERTNRIAARLSLPGRIRAGVDKATKRPHNLLAVGVRKRFPGKSPCV
jgi:hypothetical protein